MEIQIFSTIGYGFCPPDTVDTAPEGGVELLYRYVPSKLVDTDEKRVIGAFNQAASQGATTEEEADELELEGYEPSTAFTEGGIALFEAMPVYAVLRVEEQYVEWEAHWDGVPAVTLRAQQLEPLLEEALKLPPQQLWAQKHLSKVTQYLYGANDPEAAAMPMAPGLGDEREESGDLPRVAVEERVDYPWGLWKIALIAIDDEMTEVFAGWQENGEQFDIIEGSVAILRNGAFEYASVPFIKWELPATVVPNIVRWAEREEVRRQEPWAPVAIMPFYDWDSPIASIPLEAEELVGMAAAYVIPKKLDELDQEFREWMEGEIRGQL